MNQSTYSALIGATPAGRLPRLFAVAASGFTLVCFTKAGTELELLLDFSTGKTDTSPSSAIIPANSFPVFLVSSNVELENDHRSQFLAAPRASVENVENEKIEMCLKKLWHGLCKSKIFLQRPEEQYLSFWVLDIYDAPGEGWLGGGIPIIIWDKGYVSLHRVCLCL